MATPMQNMARAQAVIDRAVRNIEALGVGVPSDISAEEQMDIILEILPSIQISGRVEDIISKEGVSDATVSLFVGEYQIATVTTDQSGDFSYRSYVSENEYNKLIAAQGSVLRWIAQKDGYTTKESQTNIPADYQDAVRQGISTTIQLLAKGNIAATDIPIGFNLRGMTIEFTNTDKPMTDGQMFADEISLWGRYPTSTNTLFIMTSTFDGGEGGEWEIYIWGHGLSGNFNPVFWNINTGWRQTSFTFPDDQDYIVYANELRPAAGDSWGWQYAIVKGGTPPLDYVLINGLKWDRENLDVAGQTHFTFDEAQAAAQSVGKRTPTLDELQSLNALGSTWNDAKKGRWFGKDHALKNQSVESIFLPADGYIQAGGSTLTGVGTDGRYWSGTQVNAADAYFLNEKDIMVAPNGAGTKQSKYTVRCIRE